MKAGNFNIHDYISKLYEGADEKKFNALNEEQKAETETGKPDEAIIQQGGENKAYNWLKKEFQKGKTEVKVEMSSHEFKPGYHLDTNMKSVNDFKPEMSGQVKTSENKGKGITDKAIPFPETKFPGSGETKSPDDKTKSPVVNKTDKNESSEGGEKKESGIKVEAITKKKEGEKKEDKEEKDDNKKK